MKKFIVFSLFFMFGLSIASEQKVDSKQKESKKIEELKVAVENGYSIEDENGNNILISFIKALDYNAIEFLLEMGVNPNDRCSSKRLPLAFAIYAWDKPIIKLLLKFGADINKKNVDGKMAIDTAVSERKGREFRQLIEEFELESLTSENPYEVLKELD